MERIQGQLQATEAELLAIQGRQAALLAELKGEPPSASTVDVIPPTAVQAPRDYADTRGQLGHP